MHTKMHWALVAVTCTCMLLQSPCVLSAKLKYVEEFSKVPWQEFPGGRYKASTNSTLTATTMAGAVFDLKPGGVRELHWHNAPEWAMVIKGTCLATVLDQGKLQPTDTWNYTTSDVWYFPANLAHSVVGLASEGCRFVTGYKSPDLDELRAFSASSWLATLNVDTLAQGLGVSANTAQRILDKSKAKSPTFIAQGPVKQLVSERPSLPVERTKLTHRFALENNTFAVTDDGSYVNKVDASVFPVSKEMSGAILRLGPSGMRQLHWHPDCDEWQYVINGTTEVGVFLEPGVSATEVIRAGDLGFAPLGSGHYVRNLGKDMAHLVLIFNCGVFTSVDVSSLLGVVPPSWVASSLDISNMEAQGINYKLAGFPRAQGPAMGKKP